VGHSVSPVVTLKKKKEKAFSSIAAMSPLLAIANRRKEKKEKGGRIKEVSYYHRVTPCRA